jgi:hypothetical protein
MTRNVERLLIDSLRITTDYHHTTWNQWSCLILIIRTLKKLTGTAEIEWRIIVRSEEPELFSWTAWQKSLWVPIAYTKMIFWIKSYICKVQSQKFRDGTHLANLFIRTDHHGTIISHVRAIVFEKMPIAQWHIIARNKITKIKLWAHRKLNIKWWIWLAQ